MKKVIVTGAAGFIGSAVCRFLCDGKRSEVIGIDKMGYASSKEALASLDGNHAFSLVEADICNTETMNSLFDKFQPDGVMHLAAETHVDRSIDNPEAFIQNNIVGTFSLLEVARKYFSALPDNKKRDFRFLHVSTDEVYGSLGKSGKFSEITPYAPNSPYSASKAGSDHLARAWYKTYGLPVVISNCSNNYGPYQFPEKLIPLIIMKALNGEALPIYGTGINVRDWLFVEDHADALFKIFTCGKPGEKYNVGGNAERRNIDLVKDICGILDKLIPNSPHYPHSKLIKFVEDRPGHDERYAIDFSKIEKELGWTPHTTLSQGLEKTVGWYLSNADWCKSVTGRKYSGERLGQIKK